MRDQYRAGRAWLYGATFARLEADIRDEMNRMLGPGGFDFDRDIAAITINRWPHGYAYTPTPLYDPPAEQAARAELGRRPIGRISIAGSDAGWEAYSHVGVPRRAGSGAPLLDIRCGQFATAKRADRAPQPGRCLLSAN